MLLSLLLTFHSTYKSSVHTWSTNVKVIHLNKLQHEVGRILTMVHDNLQKLFSGNWSFCLQVQNGGTETLVHLAKVWIRRGRIGANSKCWIWLQELQSISEASVTAEGQGKTLQGVITTRFHCGGANLTKIQSEDLSYNAEGLRSRK